MARHFPPLLISVSSTFSFRRRKKKKVLGFMKKYLEQGNPASEKKSYNWERQKTSQCNHNAGFPMEITIADAQSSCVPSTNVL